MSPVVSIVTGTRNRPDDLRRLIASIETSLSWELVIADASDKPTPLRLIPAEVKANIRILPERPRLGCCKGYNRAFGQAAGEFVIWVNDDCVFESGCIDNAVEFMKNNPHIGLGCISYREGDGGYLVNSYMGLPYANFGILSRAFGNEIGWFDEVFEMYGCDNSIAFRTLFARKGIAPIRDAKITHFATKDAHRIENNDEVQRLREAEQLRTKYEPYIDFLTSVYVANGGERSGLRDQTPRMWGIPVTSTGQIITTK